MACILKAAVFSEEDSRLILQLDSSWGPGDKCGLQRSSIVSGFIKTGINNDSAPQTRSPPRATTSGRQKERRSGSSWETAETKGITAREDVRDEAPE